MKKSLFRSYLSDASRLKGEVLSVVHPKCVKEICDTVLRNDRIVIRGAGTGLVGGCVPQKDVVMDLSKMTIISNFDKDRRIIEVEAGVVLDDLQNYLSGSGLEFPIKPGSHAVCSIGGMIATDAAGGSRHGRTSAWVRWVEVVDSRGKVERKGMTELSDYVGMEGITGVIVRACLNLYPVIDRSVSLLRINGLDEVVSLIRELKQRRNILSMEFLDKRVSEGVGFGNDYHLLVEYEGSEGSSTGSDYKKIMDMKDKVYAFVSGEEYIRVEDLKILINRFPKLMEWFEIRGIPVFGHIGAGILHPCFNVDKERFISEMMGLVKRLGGQISGEYGVGLLKRGFVEINDQKILRNIKKRCDPLGKFNMGKVI